MKTSKGACAILLCCITAGLLPGVTTAVRSNDWDMLVFAQVWPETACIEGNLTHQYACSIAQNISTWTVHGIWPTLNGTLGPNYCNDSDKFNPAPIQPLLSQLTEYWPNLHTDESFYSFWIHEWEKHGTCAGSLPVLRGEYNYFNTGLMLNKKFDILNLLTAHQLVPSSQGYDYISLKASLKEILGGEISFVCFYEKKYGTQYLLQVDICLNKSFQVVDCKHSSGGCIETKPLVYPPIKHPFRH